MKRLAPIAILIFIAFPSAVLAYSGGITGYSGNPNSNSGNFCSACHSGGTAPTVSISGAADLVAGSSSDYTLHISGTLDQVAGFDISSNGGVLNINSTQASKQSGELTHNSPINVSSLTSLDITFSLTAPNTAGTITLYAAGLSANNSGSPDGDAANTATLTVTITASPKPLPPVANIQGPSNAPPNTAVDFDASASNSDNAAISRYLWDFGDDSASAIQSGVSASHQYAVDGNYTVTMAVTDENGLTGVIAHSLTIGSGGGGGGDGATLYAANCSVCHGAEGSGGSAIALAGTGVTLATVQNAVATISQMQGINLSDADLQLIVDYLASVGGPRPTDGPGLYGLLCSGCHGADAGGGSARAITGAPAIMINDALTNITAMQNIVISNAEIQLVADYLLAGGGISIPSDGAGLYQVFCAVCHGDGGHGGKFKAVTGSPASMINSAISQQIWMQDLVVNSTQVSAIASFLSNGGSAPLPSDGAGLYGVFCSVCHGADGRGDKYKVVTGTSSQYIQRALSNVSLMGALNPSSTQRSSIATFLASGGGGSKPTTGSGLYHVYCETCHGVNGNGGPVQGVRGASANSISSEINGNSNMSQLRPYLTSSEISQISSFLSGGGQ